MFARLSEDIQCIKKQVLESKSSAQDLYVPMCAAGARALQGSSAKCKSYKKDGGRPTEIGY